MRDAALAVVTEKDRRPIYEWAHDHYVFTPPLTKTDPLNIAEVRHFQAPFDSLQNDRKREVSVRAPVRSAKTVIGEVFVAWSMVNDPGETMWVTGKASLADQEWETRMERMLLASPKCRAILPDSTPQGSRRNKQTGLVGLKTGSNLFVHGNAELNLQQKGIMKAIHDEVWEWEPGRLDESYGRIGDYLRMGISKVLNISQGGEDESDWDRVYNQGHCAEWEVECQKCHEFFYPLWSHHCSDGRRAGMRWDEHRDGNGLWVIEACLGSVRYECPFCAHPHKESDAVKSDWNKTGRYKATNPKARPEKDSYHWTAVIDFPWRELVDLYLQAVNAWKQGNPEPLVKFFQKRMAENKSESALLESAVSFARQAYDLKSAWDEEALRIFTVDVQESVYWGLVRQWSKDGKSRRLWFGKLYSWAEIEAKREEFGVKEAMTAVDSGHRAKSDRGVYAACVRYGWLATKGEQEKVYIHREGETRVEHSFSELGWGDPELGSGSAYSGRKAPLIRFSSETMADRLDGLIASGLWIEPPENDRDAMDVEYRRQMAGEPKKQFRDSQTNRLFFKRVVSKRWGNHAFDCAKIQVMIATGAGCLADLG